MVSADSIELVNYVKDLEIEFNMKIIILSVMLVYALAMFWLSFKLENKRFWVVITKVIVLRAMTIPYIFFFPYLLMLLYRGIGLEAILMIMLTFYSIMFVFVSGIALLIGGEWILTYLGIDNLGELLIGKFRFKSRGD